MYTCCLRISIGFVLCRRVIENLSSQRKTKALFKFSNQEKRESAKSLHRILWRFLHILWPRLQSRLQLLLLLLLLISLLLFVQQHLLAANTFNRMQFVDSAHGTC